MFLEQLRRHAQIQATKEAVVHEDGVLTYQELLSDVQRTSAYLQMSGIRSEDVVGLAVSDEVDHLIATLALWSIGAHQLTLASHESLDVCLALGRLARVTRILADEHASTSRYPDALIWPGRKEIHHQVPDRCEVTQRSSGLLFINTSGTTGSIALVPFTETQIADQSGVHVDYASERLLRLAPIEFNNSKRHRLYCIWNGGTNVFFSGRPIGRVVEFVTKFDVTCLDVTRMHLATLANDVTLGFPTNVKVRPGGGAVPKKVRDQLVTRVTPLLYVRYATTETGTIAIAGPDDHDIDGCCGSVMPGVSVQIVGEHLDQLPHGALGLVAIKCKGMGNEYFRDSLKSQAKFVNGWFLPGDVGYFDTAGRLVLSGRSDELINLNGIKIAPAEIERVLELYPGVRAAAAIGLDSEVHGQIPVAAIEAGEELDVTLLLRFARDRLGVRAPRKIVKVEKLPADAQGKLRRRLLIEGNFRKKFDERR